MDRDTFGQEVANDHFKDDQFTVAFEENGVKSLCVDLS